MIETKHKNEKSLIIFFLNKTAYFFTILLVFSCTSVPKDYLVNNNTCNYNDSVFKITENEFNFEYNEFDSIIEEKGALLIENDSLIIEIQKNSIGKTNKKTQLTKWIFYHSNKKIESILFFLRNSSHTEIGKETYYDKQGNIAKVIDHEKGYKIC
ncbi:hypothetical protein A8C32_05245 [Flavivirga aquatica]|uniref:Lipoprotein n=1 Tax=Flavivirga aquatica TaxID=1849968 RepID=A0A1E5SHR2_9FLAO|nr:hypothetical protein [Flavivirga aquatica]OEJ98606.1 hypothetical protein A8C32_05245 [Flavivirga aquatica]